MDKSNKKIIFLIISIFGLILIISGIVLISKYNSSNIKKNSDNILTKDTIIESQTLSNGYYLEDKLSFTGVVLSQNDDKIYCLSIYITNISDDGLEKQNLKLIAYDKLNNEIDSIEINTRPLNYEESYTINVDVSEKFVNIASFKVEYIK